MKIFVGSSDYKTDYVKANHLTRTRKTFPGHHYKYLILLLAPPTGRLPEANDPMSEGQLEPYAPAITLKVTYCLLLASMGKPTP